MTNSTETQLLDAVPNQLFIGGQWIAASGSKTLDVTDPATGKVIRTISDASAEDGMRALVA